MVHDLPDDILRIILEYHALQSSRKDALRLFTVSRSVKAWTERHVFSKVVLVTMKQVLFFTAAVQGDAPFCDPARHVRFLWLLCTFSAAANHLIYVIPLCPNLIHFAFDGGNTPFREKPNMEGNFRPRLTRLSICSPSLLDRDLYSISSPIPWDHLTHIHLFGAGDLRSFDFYDLFFGPLVERLGSLQHLLIDLTYPSPTIKRSISHFYAEMVLYLLVQKDDILHTLFGRLPQLRQVVIRTNFSYMQFGIIWDDFEKRFHDEPRVIFLKKPLPNQEFYDDAFKDRTKVNSAWSSLLQDTLSDADSLWASYG